MSAKERDRLDVFRRVLREELSVVEAAGELSLSLRQARRLWKRFKAEKDQGLVHRLRGRRSNNRIDDGTRERIVSLHQVHYGDYGPTLACEKLEERHGLRVSPDTLTTLLKERGLWEPRRRRGRHRRRRERKACFGSMVQMDGSHHDWLEGRGPACVAMVMIDDATNRTLVRLTRSEDLVSSFEVFGRWCREHGVPRAVYVDRHSIYQDENAPERPTQFARAMKELGVKLIRARSPQAKGRVERRNRTLQDRLVKELRERRVRTIEEANRVLESKFLPMLNRRFVCRARRETDLHRTPPGDMEWTLCRRAVRKVGLDGCVQWKGRWLQLERGPGGLSLCGRSVEVREKRTGELRVSYADREVTWSEVRDRPKPKREIVNNRHWQPAADHPWACPAPLPRGSKR